MDRDEFNAEILRIARANRKPLTDKHKQDLQDSVYAHIKTLFPADHNPVSTPSMSNASTVTKKKPPYHKLKEFFANLFASASVPQYTMAAISVIGVGILVFLLSSNNQQTLLKIPSSLTVAGLDAHVSHLTASTRTIAPQTISERRKYYLAGITSAGIDVIANPDTQSSKDLAALYYSTTTGKDATETVQSYDLLAKDVNSYKDSELANVWLTEGYLVEILYLSALRTLNGMETDILRNALSFYQQNTLLDDAAKEIETIPEQYLSNQQTLLNTDSSGINTPGQVQSIVDATQLMHVILR